MPNSINLEYNPFGTYVGMAAISSVKDGDIPYGVIRRLVL